MRNKKIIHTLLLILTAFIWGTAFVAQSTGGDAIGPFAFNSIRSFVGCLVLMPVIFLFDRIRPSKKPRTKQEKKNVWIAGICCGIAMTVAMNFQQVGINSGTEVGKAGFLTACYIVIVPILGIFLKKKCPLNVWIGVIFALIGLYLLCINGAFVLKASDTLVLLCAFFFSIHILVIDYFSGYVDGVRMSCIQLFVAGLLTMVPMFLIDMQGTVTGMMNCLSKLNGQAWFSILYAGALSSGVAYTLQIIGQENVDATVASLLMSLESVFSVLAGWVILNQKLSLKELCGCALIFIAVVLAQLPNRKRGRNYEI